MSQAPVLYAPNVHTGGGLVLLRALLAGWPPAVPMTAFLDNRAREQLVLPPMVKVSWVAATVSARVRAEIALRATVGAGRTVLCFHGLPPLLARTLKVIVFHQNRLYLEPQLSSDFERRTRWRLLFERLASRTLHRRVSEYIVQTPAMQRKVLEWLNALGSDRIPPVRVIPFMDALPENSTIGSAPKWDFLYVADGGGHKNHRALLAAWQLLAQEGLHPSLALTLGQRDHALLRDIDAACAQSGLRITNLGQMPRTDVLALYCNARALIFPSTSESFGLPLIEAAQLGLPILASERDFVRDVCVPAQTFDPISPVSIARAVKRFLVKPEVQLALRTPSEFWSELFQGGVHGTAGNCGCLTGTK